MGGPGRAWEKKKGEWVEGATRSKAGCVLAGKAQQEALLLQHARWGQTGGNWERANPAWRRSSCRSVSASQDLRLPAAQDPSKPRETLTRRTTQNGALCILSALRACASSCLSCIPRVVVLQSANSLCTRSLATPTSVRLCSPLASFASFAREPGLPVRPARP